MEGMPGSEADAFMGEYFAFTQGIRESGQFVAGEAGGPGAMLRAAGGGLRVTVRIPFHLRPVHESAPEGAWTASAR